MTPLPITAATTTADAVAAVQCWVETNVPESWRAAAAESPAALRSVRSPAQYRQWYPTFAEAGLVVPTWQPEHGGLGITNDVARAIEPVLAPLRLSRLNPSGAQQRRGCAVQPRQRRAATAIPSAHRAQRGEVVSAVQ